MNKKEAIAYAQITLNYMQSEKYNGNITPENFGIEMKQCFNLYSHDIVENIAKAQIQASKELIKVKFGSEFNE